ncbi:ankyrin repeat domain-containing protein [Terriglobus sp.]|uniref:ankyrin repeat domain-containing protein n=1 Tax=Terriglobus sp. TaxID=1889013 RepID=UPI003B00C5B5
MRFPQNLVTLLFLSTSISAQSTDLDKKLFDALCKGNTAGIQMLLDQGAHINARESPGGATPLMQASGCTDLPTVKLLLEKGADVNANETGEESPLTEALTGLSTTLDPDAVTETVRTLIDRGANIQFVGLRGTTPLMRAANADVLVPSLNLLLAKGAQLEARDNFGDTALALSANASQPGAMSALLAHGAQVNTRNNKGVTPLMIAARTGNLQTVKLLLTHGADPNLKDNTGKTAADYARTERDLSPAAKTRVLTLLRANRPK